MGDPIATARGVRRRKPLQTVLLVSLLPVFAVVWWPLLRGRERTPPVAAQPTPPANPGADPAAVAAATPLAETAAASPAGSAGAIAGLSRHIHTVAAPYRPRWRASAAQTTTLPPGPAASAAERADALPPELVPSAILLTPGAEPVAIVNGAPVRVGDSVAGLCLVAIHEHEVHWRHGDRTHAVPLPTPALRGSR